MPVVRKINIFERDNQQTTGSKPVDKVFVGESE